jgi:hypothetical protein
MDWPAFSATGNWQSLLRIDYCHHTIPGERRVGTDHRQGQFGLLQTTFSNLEKVIHILEFRINSGEAGLFLKQLIWSNHPYL